MPRARHAELLLDDQRGAVVTKAVVNAAEKLGLPNAVLAQAIGVSVPTVSRYRAGERVLEPGSIHYQQALLLVRLFRGLDAVVGGDPQSMQSWMASPSQALGGIPRDLVQSVTGMVHAVDYVDAARARL